MTAIVFDPGEPFDIDKLNQLSNAIAQLEKNQAIGSLSSSTVTKIPKVYSGAIQIVNTVGTAGAVKDIDIDFQAANFKVKPRVVAVSTDPYTTVSVTGITQTTAKVRYTATVKSSLTAKPWIQWIAVAMEDNT